MELWIRSQDKMDLFKVNRIKIRKHTFEDGTKEYLFLNSDKLSDCIGSYESKERALEVLNEIQTRILNLQLVELEEKGTARKDVRVMSYLECVYEMPKK